MSFIHDSTSKANKSQHFDELGMRPKNSNHLKTEALTPLCDCENTLQFCTENIHLSESMEDDSLQALKVKVLSAEIVLHDCNTIMHDIFKLSLIL